MILMYKKILFAIILGLISISQVVIAHEGYGDECQMYGSQMMFGGGYIMPGFGMFYVSFVLIGLTLLIIFLILNSKK